MLLWAIVGVKKSWTDDNPGIRFYCCSNNLVIYTNIIFFNSFEFIMLCCSFFCCLYLQNQCGRAKQVIPRLLRGLNNQEAEHEISYQSVNKKQKKLWVFIVFCFIVILMLLMGSKECHCEKDAIMQSKMFMLDTFFDFLMINPM